MTTTLLSKVPELQRFGSDFKLYLPLHALSSLYLLAVIATTAGKGDEVLYYLDTFQHAISVWPLIDLDPLWTVSPIYLWVVALIDQIFGDPIMSGRILSFLSFNAILSLQYFSAQKEKINWGYVIVLFHPFILVYACRAHPLLPTILFFVLFIKGMHKSRAYYLLLLMAVNFQVYVAGFVGGLLPVKDHKEWSKIREFFLIGTAAALGIVLIWVLWGGFYPEHFLETTFYKEVHVGGTISLGYIPLVFIFTGIYVLILGGENKYGVTAILFPLLLLLVFWLLGEEPTGMFSNFVSKLASKLSVNKDILYYLVLFLFAFGWVRLNKGAVTMLLGLLGAAILLVPLPYLFERIAIFSSLSPLIYWSYTENSAKNWNLKFVIPVILISLLASAGYFRFGSL